MANHWVASLVATVVYFTAVLLPFRQTYWSNDNVGILYDIRSGHTVSFMSQILGSSLSFLYLRVNDSVPWHGLTLYLILAVAFWVALATLRKLRFEPLVLAGVVLVLMVLFSRFVMSVGYNGVSIIAGFAALFALLIRLRGDERPGWRMLLLLGALFACSYLVRTSGLRAVVVFSVPVVGWRVLRRYRVRVLPFLVFLLPVVGVMAANNVATRRFVSDEYVQYRDWNKLRGKFHDYPVSALNKDNEAILEANGWTDHDYDVLIRWMFFDESKYNVETMRNIFAHSVPLTRSQAAGLTNGFQAMGTSLTKYGVWWAVLVLLAVVTARPPGGRRWPAILLPVSFFAIGTLMDVFLRYPPRIAWPVFVGAVLYGFLLLGETGTDRRRTLVLGVGLILLAVAGLPETVERVRRIQEKQVAFYHLMDEVRALEPDFVLAQPSRGLEHQYRDPLRVHDDLPEFVPGGWGIFSPRFYGFLRDHGMTRGSELWPRIHDNPQVYVIGRESFMKWARFSTRRKSAYERVGTVDDEVGIFRFVSRRGKGGGRPQRTAVTKPTP